MVSKVFSIGPLEDDVAADDVVDGAVKAGVPPSKTKHNRSMWELSGYRHC